MLAGISEQMSAETILWKEKRKKKKNSLIVNLGFSQGVSHKVVTECCQKKNTKQDKWTCLKW